MTAARLKVKHPPTPEEEEEQQAERQVWQAAKDVKKGKLEWVLPYRLPKGAFSILEGVKGAAKSTLSCYLAACVSTGKPVHKGRKTKPASVLWCPGEEDVETCIRPRLEAAGADLSRVLFPPVSKAGSRMKLRFPGDVSLLAEQIQSRGVTLILIDPLSSHIEAGYRLKDDQDIHAVLDPLAELAFASKATIIGTRNLSKNSRADKIDRGLGGAAVAGVARAVLTIDYPNRLLTRRVLRVTAGNMQHGLGPLEFHVQEAGDWGFATGFKEVNPENDQEEDAEDDAAEKSASGDARTILLRMLADGPRATLDILKEAKSIEVSSRTLRKVAKKLGVIPKRRSVSGKAFWEWNPPIGGFPNEKKT